MTRSRVFAVAAGFLPTSLLAALIVTGLTALTGGCTRTANVSDVTMALDGEGLRERNVFFTDSKEIHCVAELGIGRDGVTIEGLIRQTQRYDFTARKFFDTNRVLASAENSPGRADGPQKFDVQLQKTNDKGDTGDEVPFFPGRYQCEIRLDGELEGVALFNVLFPECPISQIKKNAVCIGFYEEEKECPAYGNTSTDEAKCTCNATTGWACP